MHELGLIYQMVKTVDNVVAENHLSEVDKIVLQVGEMTDVVPNFLTEAWQVAKESTAYPNAKLELEIIKGTAKCLDCNFESEVKDFDLTCPKCNSPKLKLISGREFEIKEILAK